MATYLSLHDGQLVFEDGTIFSSADAANVLDQLPNSPNRYLREQVEGLISGIAAGVAPKLRGMSKVSLVFENGATFSRANVAHALRKISGENTNLPRKLEQLLAAMDDQARAKPIQRSGRAVPPNAG